MNLSSVIKTRFAPSPTGYIHLGNARTALFNALLARKHSGILLLRIEDTDKERSKQGFVQALLDDLRWLGIVWQEGPEAGGEHGPYLQSERGGIYQHYYEILAAKGLVYPCFCSAAELALARKRRLATGQPPRYPGTCAQLTDSERLSRWKRGLQSALRYRIPPGRTIVFNDLVRGLQRYDSDDIGDFIIRRADGGPQFFFTNAVDDALMGVSHVLRGEDHLSNTPRQLLLLEALELPVPQYGHIAMVTGPDGSPLSKRQGSRNLRELREAGFLPEALTNYLARLGHSYEQGEKWLNFADLAAGFTVERLGRGAARYDETQLLNWQTEAVLRADADRLWAWMGEDVQGCVPVDLRSEFIEVVRPNIRFPAEAYAWAERLFGGDLVLNADSHAVIERAGVGFFTQALAAYERHGASFKALTDELKRLSGAKGKALFMPLRVALTGETYGPELARILALMPPALVRRRLLACC
jgi:nondiscriminating glutamyl-tRNA synthetase